MKREFTLEDITSAKRLMPPRIIVTGRPKVGKTAFAVGAQYEGTKPPVLVAVGRNKPIVLPIKGEEGIDAYDVPSFPTLNTFDEVIGALNVLKNNKQHPHRTVVIDSLTTLASIIEDQVCEENGQVDNVRKVSGFKTGEAAVKVKWRELTSLLDELRDAQGLASVLISHIRVTKVPNQDIEKYDAYDLNLDTDVCELLKCWSDITMMAAMKIAVKPQGEDKGIIKAQRLGVDQNKGQRFLFTQPHPAHPTGGRGVYGQLPPEIPLDWQEFQDAVVKANNAQPTTQEDQEA